MAYLHSDQLGSVRTITSATGTSAKETIYRPFGEAVEHITGGSSAPETKGFIGECYDADAGLQYLNARYYDPALGMFIQPDWFEVTQAGGAKTGTAMSTATTGSIISATGIKVVGFTKHGVNRAVGDGAKRAGTSIFSIRDTLLNPRKIKTGIDRLNRPFQTFTGQTSRVTINPSTGKIISVNPLGRGRVIPPFLMGPACRITRLVSVS